VQGVRGVALADRTLLDMPRAPARWGNRGRGVVEHIEACVGESSVDAGEWEVGRVVKRDGVIDDGDVDGEGGGLEGEKGVLYGAHATEKIGGWSSMSTEWADAYLAQWILETKMVECILAEW
jgi:hypothetical protein